MRSRWTSSSMRCGRRSPRGTGRPPAGSKPGPGIRRGGQAMSEEPRGALLVRGGTVVTAAGARRAHIRCRDGRIVQVGPDFESRGEPVLDAHGALVFPGIIDPHLHFALVSGPHRTADDFDTGSAAALSGGVTMFV